MISASRPSGGYPSAALALYGRREVTNKKLISLTPGFELEHVLLVLEDPNPVITFQVQDVATGCPIENARILVEWSDDSDSMISQTIQKEGAFTRVLPDHSIHVEISAPMRISCTGKRIFLSQSLLESPFPLSKLSL